ncbi:DUF4214 domain-containing protein [Duganella sp. HH105]|uniref:DUF4214 domain-containing protein n=1 Tax=Duganella sp. HH105 TaxID=1781067 RepID=UPI000877BEE3|nr:DUF4214 domain-containing protein [Duganella sp. HH105]OEZ63501.1 tRNA3(Ser)-specific nuclease WapA precursor [Duganella sp. HH105]
MVAIIGGNGLGTLNTSKAVLGQQGTFGNAATGNNKESAYLNVMTGNLSLQDSDDFLASHGINVELTRMYNSQGAITNDFGANGASWKYGMSRKVVVVNPAVALNATGSQVALTEADGSVTVFLFDPRSNPPCYLTRDGAGAYKRLTWVPATGEWICRQDKAVDVNSYDVYDSTHGGRLVRTFERDAAGAEIVRQRYIYDDTAGVNQGRLVQVTDASGASGVAGGAADSTGAKDANGAYIANDQTHFDYDPVTGDLLQIRSVLANGSTFIRTRYGYDAQHRLKTVTVDLTPEDGSIADNNVYTTSYEYDPVSKGVSRVSQSDGSELRFTYVLVGGNYRVASFTDALNRLTTIDYSVANKPAVTDPLGVKTTYTFDANGNLTQIDTLPVGGPVQTNKFAYDSFNNLSQITHPDGTNSVFVPNAQGNFSVILDQTGSQIANLYDNNIANGTYNKLLNHTEYTGRDTDGIGSAVIASGPVTTRYVYDTAARVHYKLSPQGGITEYLYYANGDLMSELHYNGGIQALGAENAVVGEAAVTAALAAAGFDKSNISRTDYVYDARGLLAKSTRYATVDANRAGLADGAESVSYFTYDQAGQLLLSRDGAGNQTTYTYDGLGRVLTRTDANNTLVQSIYDARSNLTVTTTAKGAATPSSTASYVRNGAGQLLSVQLQYGAQSGTTTYAYDAAGQLRRSTDPSGKNTYWLYDTLGRKAAQIEHNGVMTEYTYNKLNQLTKATRYATTIDPGLLTDAQGKPASVTAASLRPLANPADRSNWTDYDAIGNVVATVDANGYLTRYVYDGMNRLTQTIVRAKPIDTSKLDGLDIAAAYAAEATAGEDRVSRVLYNGDQVAGKLDALGYLTEYKYDAGGRLIDTISYDSASPAAALAAGDLTALRPAAVAADRHVRNLYNGRDQLVGTIDADNFVTEFRYDAAGNLAYKRAYAGAAATPAGKALDKLGVTAGPLDRITTYTYNALNKLDTESSASGAYTRYRYDADGNVVAVERGTAGAAEMASASRYDGAGHLIAQLNAEGAAKLAALGATPPAAAVAALWASCAQTYSYNNAGQRLSATDVLGNRTLYFYDALGNLTHTVNPLGQVLEQRYDNFGQVIKTIQYDKALAPAVLSGLIGGKVDAPFSNALLALANLSADQTALFYYDNKGQLSYSVDGAGGVKGVSYNAFGQARISTLYGGQLGAAALSVLSGGKLDNQLSAQGGAADAATRQLDAILANAADSKRSVFYYDAAGHLNYTVDAAGGVDGHLYNVGNSLSAGTTIEYAAQLAPAALTGAQTEIAAFAAANLANAGNTVRQYTYNRRGLVADVADAKTGGNHTLTSYNGFGDLVKQTQLATAASIVAAPAADIALQTIYDLNGRVRASVDGTGTVTAYQYDGAGHVVDKVVYANALNGYDTSADIAKTYNDAMAAGLLSDPLRDQHQRFVYVNGNLTATLSAQQVRSTLNGQGQKVYSSDWAVATQSWDANGRVVQRTAHAGAMLNVDGLAPDAAAVLNWAAARSALTLSAPQDDAIAHDASTRMVYDAAGHLVASATAQRHANGTIEWAVVRQVYDADGNVVKRTAYATPLKALAPTDAAILAAADSVSDAITVYQYDGQNRVILSAIAQGQQAAGALPPYSQQWAVSTASYDSAGNVLSRTQYATLLRADTLPADPLNYLPSSALDRTTRYVYDALNRVVVSVDAAGGVSKLVYDNKGNITQRISFAEPAANPAAVTAGYGATPAAADRVSRTVYDLQNRPVFDIDPLGQVVEHRYDVLGNVVATVRYAMPIAAASLAAIVAATTPAQAKALIPAGGGADRLERYTYDQDGRLRFTIDAAGYLKETVYTAQGRVAESRQYLQAKAYAEPLDVAAVKAEAKRQLDAGSVGIVQYSYDAGGNLASTTDAQAVPATEFYKYDALGRKTSYQNQAGSIWTYAYDSAGHMVLETSPQVKAYTVNMLANNGGWNDGVMLAMLTRLEYDALGNLSKRTEAAGTASERITEYRYDNLGRQTQTILQSVKIYDDGADQKLSDGAYLNPEKDSGPRITTVTYNSFGDAVANQDVGGKLSYKVYDKRGQVRYDVDALGYVSGYERDRYGNVTRLTRYDGKLGALAGNKTPAQASDAEIGAALTVNAAADRSIRTAYDKLDRVTRVSEALVAVTGPNTAGVTTGMFAAKTTDTVYTTFGDVSDKIVYGADAGGVRVSTASDTRFYYNQRGDKIQQLDFLSYGAGTPGTGIGSGYLTTFSYNYDSDAKLSTVTQTEYSDVMTWTATGPVAAPAINSKKENRTQLSAYDRNNRLVSESRYTATTDGQAALDIAVTRYGYDALGRQTSVTNALGGTSYTYFDALGRTTGVSQAQTAANANIDAAGAPLTEFKLDILGNTVLRVDYAKGALNAVTGEPVDRNDPDNRVTTTSYNLDGHAVAVLDANQNAARTSASPIYTSYDIYGRVARQARAVLADGKAQTAFQITRYDDLGRVREVETPGNQNLVDVNAPVLRNHKTNVYNAFGEVTASYLSQGNGAVSNPASGQQLSYTNYDQAGRAWRSNGGNGVDKIALFDAMGNVTAQIVSTGSDIHQLQRVNGLADLAGMHNLQRTDMRYDLLGHMIDQSAAYQVDTTYALAAAGDGFVKVALDPTQSLPPSNLIVVGDASDAGRNLTIVTRPLGSTGAFTSAGAPPVALVAGYMVFRADFLATGYEYQVYATPAGEASYQIGAGQVSTKNSANGNINRQIISLYLMLFNRAPDAATLNLLAAKMDGGTTLEQLVLYMLGTPDGVDALKDGNLAFLTRLHDVVLKLGADPVQVQQWRTRFEAGSGSGGDTRGAALLAILYDNTNAITRRANALYNYLTVNGGNDPAVAASVLAHADLAADGAIAEGNAAGTLEKQRASIIRLFVTIFGRMPDAASLELWVNTLRAGSTLAAIGDAMFNTDEGKLLYPPLPPLSAGDAVATAAVRQFAARTTTNLLGRPPAAGEYDTLGLYLYNSTTPLSRGAFVSQLVENQYNGGRLDANDLQAIRDKIAVSLAYLALPPDGSDAATQQAASRAIISAINSASDRSTAVGQALAALQAKVQAARDTQAQLQAAITTTLEDRRLLISRLYITLFGRAPDRDGMAYYLNRMANAAVTPEELATALLASSEATGNAALFPPGLTDTQFVNRIYNLAFNTVPDTAAMGNWMQQLTVNSRAKVVLNIVNAIVSGSYSAGPDGLALFNNKVAVGVTYAVNMGSANSADARTLLGLVTATDVTAAINYAMGATVAGSAAAAASTALAASLTDAIALNTGATQAQQSTASAAAAAATAATASNANPLALATLRAAKMYAAYMNRGRTGSLKPLDLNEVATLARAMVAGASDAAALASLFNSAEGLALYPAAGFDAAAHVKRMYQQVLGMQPPADRLAYWSAQFGGGAVDVVTAQLVNELLNTAIDPASPQAEAMWTGRAAFEKDVSTGLAAMSAAAATAITTATTAGASYAAAGSVAKASTAAASAAAVQAAMSSAAANTGYVLDLSRLYVGILNRGPGAGQQRLDIGGLNFYIRARVQGVSMAAIADAMIADSVEGKAMYGGVSDLAFITRLYQQTLGRPLAAGDTFWLDRLKLVSRGTVAADFIKSLIDNPLVDAREYTGKASFDKAVQTALQPLLSTATPAASAALKDVGDTLALKDGAKTAFDSAVQKLADAKLLTPAQSAPLLAAQAARPAGQYYQQADAATKAALTELLVAFGMPADLGAVNARLADLAAGRATLTSLAGLGAGVTPTSLNDRTAFIGSLYQKVLHRPLEDGAQNFWITRTASYTDASQIAKLFFDGAHDELYNLVVAPKTPIVRNDFVAELAAATAAAAGAAQTLIDNYNAALADAPNWVAQQIATAQLAKDAAEADYTAKNTNWSQATVYNQVAQLTLAAVNSAIAVQGKAVTADNDKSVSMAADALVAAAAATVGLGPNATKADFDLVLANAKAFQPALALEVTQSAKLADVAAAGAATAHVATLYATLPPRSLQALQVTQMYQVLLARVPTQVEMAQALGLFVNGRTLADQALMLMAANPAVFPGTLTNDAYVTKLVTNATGHAPTAPQLRQWSDQLGAPASLSRGALMANLLTDLTRTTFNADTLAFNAKLTPLLNTLQAGAKADAAAPSVANFVTANAFIARDAVLVADADAIAKQTPSGAYANEIAQLYLMLLGRAPDTATLTANIALRAGGKPLLAIAQTLLASADGAARFPAALANADFIKALFQLGLGRAADAAELTAWGAKLTANADRAQLAISLIADLYAYGANDGVKLSARTAFMGRVSEALTHAAIDAAGIERAVAAMQGIALQPVLTQYSAGPVVAKNSGYSASQTPLGGQSRINVDRWGNVLSISDARDPNWKIAYSYNYNNQQLSQTLNSLTPLSAPASKTVYDALGRVVKTTDFNGNSNTQRYDSNGNVAKETHADGGLVTSTYDLFGNRLSVKRWDTASTGVQINYAYDHLGHLTGTKTAAAVNVYVGENTGSAMLVHDKGLQQLEERFEYDELGRKTRSTDAAGVSTFSSYDLDGNVISTWTEANLYRTRTVYDAFHHRIGTKDAMDHAMSWQVDSSGRINQFTDMSGAVTDYRYDAAGNRTLSTVKGNTITQTYENGLLVRIVNSESGLTTNYTYDRVGNRLSETQSYAANSPSRPARVQNNALAYDMQNRLTGVKDDLYQLSYSYDDNGNRTSITTAYTGGTAFTKYNAYDKMNRQTVVNADSWDIAQSTGVLGKLGHQITYDLAGNRTSDSYIGVFINKNDFSYQANTRTTETYVYDGAGRLQDSYRDGVLFDSRSYDAVGRITVGGEQFKASDASRRATYAAGIASQRRTFSYDIGGHITRQQEYNYDDPHQDVYFVGDQWNPKGGYDAMGNLTGYTVVVEKTDRSDNGTYQIDYVWTDSAREKSVKLTLNNTAVTSVYDSAGNRTQVIGENGQVKKQFWYDADGHVQSKIDDGKAGFSLIVNGQVLGEENARDDNILGSAYQPASASALAAAPSAYSVQSNSETLQSIAQAIWGDSKLWYLIADANGLGSDTALKVGDILRIPSRVNTVHNDYATFKPYNASDAIGNTAPALPPPSHGGGCGAMGQLIMVVVAVAVTVLTAGLGAVVSAALGSIASQAVGMAIGAQDGFSWKGVALAALSAGITDGVSSLATPSGALSAISGDTWQAVAARAAVSNVTTQGVANLTGLQHGFSWAGVAASAAGAAVGSQVGAALDKNDAFKDAFSALGQNAARIANASISGFSAGLTTAIMRGGKIAVAQIATDAFGNALGSSLADSVNGDGRTFGNRLISNFTSIGAVDSSGPQVDISGLLDGLPSIASGGGGTWSDDDGAYPKGNRYSFLTGGPAAAGAAGPSRLSVADIALAAKMFGDTSTSAPATRTSITRQIAASTGLIPSPFADGARMASGPVSAVGGFDRYGNSINGAQFDLGQTWVGDVVKAPLNFATNSVELIGNNLNLSFTLPGDPTYIPFMQSMKLPYSTEAGSYAEFGLGLLSGGVSAWARTPGVAASEIASVRTFTVATAAAVEETIAAGGTTYAQRLAQTPISNGYWSAGRGESIFTSTHPDVVPILGEQGISYTNAYPNFGPVSAGQVEIPNMTINRTTNFAQADAAFAKQSGMTPSQVKEWRYQNSYTWHEVEDIKTMQLVPTDVNAKFGHVGGIGELKAGKH